MDANKIIKQIIFWTFCFILIFKADWLLSLGAGPYYFWWVVFIFSVMALYIWLLLTKKM